ncbi:LYR motif-containing protein 1 isoform X2 [Marmota monax]|nr:LYR motif-containing protein 1 isoform X2 [Marmota monax]
MPWGCGCGVARRRACVTPASRGRLGVIATSLGCQCFWTYAQMTMATRQEVLGLYRRVFRLARKWQAASGQMEDTIREKQYILNEARTLFQKNKNLTDRDLIKQCIDECTARIEIGLHYQIPYPRPVSATPVNRFICLQWALRHYKAGDFEPRRN